MKLLPIQLFAFLSLASVGTFAQSAPESPTPAAQATNKLGKVATIKGKVAQVTKRDTVIYANFEKKYPDHVFSAVIFKKQFPDFPDVEKLLNKTVEVTGTVTEFKGYPQIVLTNKSQLRLSQ